MSNNAFIWTLFAVCFYAYISAIAYVSDAVPCPTSGVINGPQITAPNVSCTQLEFGAINRTARVDWNTGYYSQFNFQLLFSGNSIGIIVSVDAGPVISGTVFVGKYVALIGDNNPSPLLGCELDGVNSFVGVVTLLIFNGIIPVLSCLGNTTLTFEPPLTNTPETANVTLQITLYGCLNTVLNIC